MIGWTIAVGVIAAAVFLLRVLQRRFPRFGSLIATSCGERDAANIAADGREGFIFWGIAGAIFLIGAFSFLEIRQPYYFTQDDALVAELPGMLSGCRSVWTGIWPDYDPCRLMGGPLASTGVFSLTYPPTYLSYAIARHLLRNEFALLEVFAALHLAAGYVVTTLLCRRLGMRPMIACCAALSFLLSGGILIMGRSWHTFIPIVLYMPLLMLAVERLVAEPINWKWALGTGIVAAALFHVGFPQLWFYAMLLMGCSLLLLLVGGAISFKRLFSAWPAGLIALGLIVPLLLPQLAVGRDVKRPAPYGTGITSEWLGALLPYPLVKVAHPMGWGSTDVQYMGHFIYFGTVFAVLFIFSAVAILACPSRRTLSKNVWVFCAVIALLLCMGDRGLLFSVLSKLPLIHSVNNNPFRVLPLFVLFAVTGAGLFAERGMRQTTKTPRWTVIVACLTILLLGYHVTMARPSFYTYGFKPYPPLPGSLSKKIIGPSPARMISWTTKESISPLFAATLPKDLPMLQNLPAFSGYDPLLEYRNSYLRAENLLNSSPIEALRAYAVRWNLISSLLHKPALSPNPLINARERSVRDDAALKTIIPSLRIVAHAEGVRLGELSEVSPLAFSEAQPSKPLPMTAGGDGIRVRLKGRTTAGKVVVNFLWDSRMRATVDGMSVKISRDKWQRMVVAVPADAKLLHIRYSARWMRSSAMGFVLFLIGLLGALRRRRLDITVPDVDIDAPN